MKRFTLLCSFVLLFSMRGLAQTEKTTIIFVCEHGGARSTIASAYFNDIAKKNNLPYQSVFRGLTPDSVITKETRAGLFADGFETKSLSPAPLSAKDIKSNGLIISLDCTIPSSYKTYHAWSGIPPISEDYNAARNAIVKLLNDLAKELKSKQGLKKTHN